MLESILTGTMTLETWLLCTGVSLLLGIACAAVFMIRNRYSRSFVVTLALLPAVVQLIIMLVNGNLGAGVAVAGAFGLVRFRSAPGTAREICSLFLSMALGLATGMGYLGIAVLFFVIVSAVQLLLVFTGFGGGGEREKELRITIPEHLDYTGLFDDIFQAHTTHAALTKVKTSNMGSLYDLTYRITLKDEKTEKAMIDEIRCRNGNLNISCGRVEFGREEL